MIWANLRKLYKSQIPVQITPGEVPKPSISWSLLGLPNWEKQESIGPFRPNDSWPPNLGSPRPGSLESQFASRNDPCMRLSFLFTHGSSRARLSLSWDGYELTSFLDLEEVLRTKFVGPPRFTLFQVALQGPTGTDVHLSPAIRTEGTEVTARVPSSSFSDLIPSYHLRRERKCSQSTCSLWPLTWKQVPIKLKATPVTSTWDLVADQRSSATPNFATNSK